jgi:murein DD-endopeptidase MepM/ murein hydrolase activator NlpD
MMRYWLFCIFAVCRINAAEPAAPAVEPFDLRLPTENNNLFNGSPEKFYMYVDRTFEGVASKPWEGGAFGFVRTPVKVNDKVILRQFHEGIDIAPVKRDKAGNPLDLVSSIADGTVVHTSPVAGRSNYGKYVVVAHEWESSRVFSLYAHLADVSCKPGDPVKAGGLLGRMGYTGAGINRTRAHLHLELGLMLSARYDDWHASTGKGINHHGIYNGMNFAGADPAAFFLGRRKNPQLRFSEFVANTPVYFKVAVPAAQTPELLERYPWLRPASAAPEDTSTPPPSWEISFSATGLPTRIAPGQRKVDSPVITQIRPGDVPHRFLTRYLVNGEGSTATLSNGAIDLVNLLTGNFPAQPAKPAHRPAGADPATAGRREGSRTRPPG